MGEGGERSVRAEMFEKERFGGADAAKLQVTQRAQTE